MTIEEEKIIIQTKFDNESSPTKEVWERIAKVQGYKSAFEAYIDIAHRKSLKDNVGDEIGQYTPFEAENYMKLVGGNFIYDGKLTFKVPRTLKSKDKLTQEGKEA